MSMVSAPGAGLSRAQGEVNSSTPDRPLFSPVAAPQILFLPPKQVSLSSSNHSHSTLSTQISGHFDRANLLMASHRQTETHPVHSSSRQHADDTCRRCGYGGGDIAVKQCGCVLHARCASLPSSIAPLTNCPHCSQRTDGMFLIPMIFDKNLLPNSSQSFEATQPLGYKRKISEEDASAVNGEHRTGRWSTEEITYADELSNKFEAGQLPLMDGVRLNDFLSRMLRCPKSRLTKKMKYSKLNSKCFKRTAGYIDDPVAAAEFSVVEEAFFESVLRRHERSDIQFVVQKQWREMFSTFCFKMGYVLDGDEWLRSIEDIERYFSEAKDAARMAKRKMMLGKALKEDALNPKNGVIINGTNNLIRGPQSIGQICVCTSDQQVFPPVNPPPPLIHKPHSHSIDVFGDVSNHTFPSNEQMPLGVEPSNEAEEFLSLIRDKIIVDDHHDHRNHCQIQTHNEVLVDSLRSANSFWAEGDCSPFLKESLDVLESIKAPFDHVDLWVPSFSGDTHGTCNLQQSSNQPCRLCFAGSATSNQTVASQRFKYESFGEYSQRFSFDLGCGLPGRAFKFGAAIWEGNVQHSSFEQFERRGAAIQYGIKTVLALPVPAANVGYIVVLLYSCDDLPKDDILVKLLHRELTELMPTPSWKIVVDVGSKVNRLKSIRAANLSVSALHGDPPVQRAHSTPTYEDDYFDSSRRSHDLSQIQASQRLNSSGTASSSFTDSIAVETEQSKLETTVLDIMCQHMPSEPHSAMGPYIQGFMTVRLIILKDSNQRTEQDSMLLGTILGSYSAYVSAQRESKDIALLLARDCMFLRQLSEQ